MMVVALAILFSSLTLWLVQSQIKYPLFILEVFVVLLIYSVLTKRYDLSFSKLDRFIIKGELSKVSGFVFDLLLIASSALIVVASSTVETETGIIYLILAFLSTSILSGHALLNISGITKYFSKLEVLVLSYISSFILSGFCTLILLGVNENTRSLIIPSFFIVLGSVSVFLRIRRKRSRDIIETEKPRSFSNNIDILAIALSVIFYLIFFYYTYPNFTLLPASDVSRHYSDAIILSRTPDLYTNFSYILFHAFEATFRSLSGFQQPITSFLSIQVLLNLFLPLSVYVLAKRFLGNLDRRIPAISTLFYSILSNFSFIYFTQLKVLNTSSTEIQLLQQDVAEKAFNGTINFLQPFGWFVPLSVSFVMFIAVFLLLRIHTIPRAIFIPLYSVLIFAMYLVHVSETVVFVIFIAVYSFVFRNTLNGNSNNGLRLDDALLSSFLGMIAASIFFGYAAFVWTSELRNTNASLGSVLVLILPLLLVGLCIIWRRTLLRRIHFATKHSSSRKFFPMLSTILVVVYLFGFLTWIFIEGFKTSAIYNLGIAPWFIYPVMLGIVGVLALLSIRYMRDILPNNSVSILLASLLILFLMGRVVSFVNLNLAVTGYWEKRFLLYLFLSASLLAPIPLVKLMEQFQVKINAKRNFVGTNGFLTAIICIIILSGFSSIVLQSEYWFSFGHSSPNRISEGELQGISYLKRILQHDGHALIITPSQRSSDIVTFAGPGYIFPLPQVALASNYPDVPLLTLVAHNLNHAYLYMDALDSDILQIDSQSWLVHHLLPMLPVVFSNGQATIYNATHVSFPLPNSDTSLLIPSDSIDNSWLYAYDVVSQSGKNYTVMYDTDSNALKSKTVILSFDPKQSYNFYQRFSSRNSTLGVNGWNVISGNWKSYSDGLHAGDKLNSLENIILSPISAKNLTSSTSFRMNSASPRVPSYISIVYSWADSKNYQYAGITTINNTVYVSFTNIINGERSFYPPWPGAETNLKVKPGELLNLTLSIRDQSSGEREQLFLNGTRYADRISTDNTKGYLGLSYGRMQNVIFEDFKLRELSKLNVRPISDYINYVKAGGHLYVINTDGYGDIAHSPIGSGGIPIIKTRESMPFHSYNPNRLQSSIRGSQANVTAPQPQNVTNAPTNGTVSKFATNVTSATGTTNVTAPLNIIKAPNSPTSPLLKNPSSVTSHIITKAPFNVPLTKAPSNTTSALSNVTALPTNVPSSAHTTIKVTTAKPPITSKAHILKKQKLQITIPSQHHLCIFGSVAICLNMAPAISPQIPTSTSSPLKTRSSTSSPLYQEDLAGGNVTTAISNVPSAKAPSNFTSAPSNVPSAKAPSNTHNATEHNKLQATIGDGRITYLDIQPILTNYNKNHLREEYSALGRISQFIDLRPLNASPPNYKGIRAIFRAMSGTGNFQATTSSIVFPTDGELKSIKIQTDHGGILSMSNVSNLRIDGYPHFIIESHNYFSLANGHGLYAHLSFDKMNNSGSVNLVTISLIKPATISGLSSEHKPFRYNSISNVDMMSNQALDMYARQPTLRIEHSNVTFNELYAGQIYTKVPVNGADLAFSGKIYLPIFMSDSYTLSSNISLDGSTHRMPPLSSYNELSSLLPPFSIAKLYSLNPLVRVLLLIPFLVSAIFILYSRASKS